MEKEAYKTKEQKQKKSFFDFNGWGESYKIDNTEPCDSLRLAPNTGVQKCKHTELPDNVILSYRTSRIQQLPHTLKQNKTGGFHSEGISEAGALRWGCACALPGHVLPGVWLPEGPAGRVLWTCQVCLLVLRQAGSNPCPALPFDSQPFPVISRKPANLREPGRVPQVEPPAQRWWLSP